MNFQLLTPYIRCFFITDKYQCSPVNVYADDYRIFMGIKDGCALIVNNEEYALKRGTVAIIPPKTFYRLRKNSPSEILIINFDMDATYTHMGVQRPIPASQYSPETNLSSFMPAPFNELMCVEADDDIFQKFISLCEEYGHQDFYYQDIASAELKALLVRLASKNTFAKKYPPYFESIIAYVDKEFLSSPSNSELASIFGFNKNYISNVFKKYTGSTLHSYITSKKAQYACQLLAATDMSIGEIADAVGFSSQNRFSEFFKNKYNMSPSEYRKGFIKY